MATRTNPSVPANSNPGIESLAAAVRAGDRAGLGRALSLVESRTEGDRTLSGKLLTLLMPDTGNSIRLGITGVPGVGKSTFIDALGSMLTDQGRKVAVLAIDPSSSVSGGSILADKTRMTRLSVDDRAFVRPSPTGGTLGGVAARTREAMLLCEAAGYEIIFVETVGVGQSETIVADMTDTFLVLMLPGGGDELQGIKRGMMELADVIAVNKADGESEQTANLTVRDYDAAMRLVRSGAAWRTPVLACSATNETGIAEVWAKVTEHHESLSASGALAAKRGDQRRRWMWSIVDEMLRIRHLSSRDNSERVTATEDAVARGEIPPGVGAARILGE